MEISHRDMPHWEQVGVCYFLTFRTLDSIPTEVMTTWQLERERWLEARGIDPKAEAWHSHLAELPVEIQQAFHQQFSKRMHAFLDTNAGECLLRRTDLREIVAGALSHFDESRYDLGGYVIMPNHVHVLVQCSGETKLHDLGHSWKRYTARLIHERLGRKGHFWQTETYDHIVRSEVQFEHYRNYIRENPAKAGLRAEEYSLYLSDLEGAVE